MTTYKFRYRNEDVASYNELVYVPRPGEEVSLQDAKVVYVTQVYTKFSLAKDGDKNLTQTVIIYLGDDYKSF